MVRKLPCSALVSLAAAAVAVLASAAPASAALSTGSIERAEVDAGWTAADLAGIVHRPTFPCLTPRPSGPKPPSFPGGPEEPAPEPLVYFSSCAWVPYATLGSAPCSSPDRGLANPGPGVQVVWSGGEREGAGSAPFDLPAVPLAHGAAASLLCLAAIEAAVEPIACAAATGVACPPYAIVGRAYELDSALLKPRPAFLVGGPVPSPAGVGPSGGEGSKPRNRRCRGAKHRRRAGDAAKRKAGKGSGRKRCRRR